MKVKLSTIVLLICTACGDTKFAGQTGGQPPQEQAKPQPVIQQPQTPPPTTLPPQSVDPSVPASAVTQGSFTVWAEPENPHCIPYKIHIRVKLPSNTANYTRQDLSGMLIGTDGYAQNLQAQSLWTFIGGGRFVFSGDAAELVVPVPAAENLVQDTINVRSQLLNEQQTLRVIFGNGQSQSCTFF